MDIGQATPEYVQQYLLGPLVGQWYARFRAADRAKDRFNVLARICRQFFGSSSKAMWEDSFRREFYPAVAQPQFMVSLNKAFELVSIIGPSLYWEAPARQVKSPDQPDQAQIAMMLGVQAEEGLQQIQQQQQADRSQRELRNSLASLYLEFSQREQPGGLHTDIELAIQEALVTGMGCIWTETYQHRGTQEILTGCFYDSVDNLLIDPDSRDPKWRDVKWISRRHCEPVWVVERRFGYPPGYLTGRGTSVSAEYHSRQETDINHSYYNDMLEWYEVWSCGGVGARTSGVNAAMGQALDQLTGDYCYLCVTLNVPHPLNLPPILVQTGTVEQIKEALRWRSPRFGDINELWKDRRWPVSPLIFYPIARTPWPMAVLGPGIGHLLAMNILLVSQLSQAWDRRRDILVAYEHMVNALEGALKTEDNPAIIRINAASNMPVSEVVNFVKRPDIGGDLLSWLQYLDNQFQMATGLDDIHYGISQKQVRVSSDIEARTAASNVRPEKMAKDVQQWVNQFSTHELWLAVQHVDPQGLDGLFGEWGVQGWAQFLQSLPFEELIREVQVFVEASDMRRPNREKDMADLERLLPFYLPILQQYGPMTGDSAPINALLARWFEAMGMRDVEELYLGDWRPAVDPQAQEMQQRMLELEAQNLEAQTGETQAKATARMIDAMYKQRGAAPAQQQKLEWTEIEKRQKMRMAEEEHMQNLVHQQELMKLAEQAKAKQGSRK